MDTVNQAPEDIKVINQRLIDLYGSDLNYRPNFRLVWGPSMIEKRTGWFEEWYMQQIFLRRWFGLKELKKYPQGVWGECFILERIFSSLNFANKLGVNAKPPSDVYEWDGYEPVWSFKINLPNGEKLAVRPVWKAVELVVHTLLYGAKESLIDAYDKEEKDWSDEHAEIKMMLDDDLPFKIMQMKHGEGIVVPNNFGDGTIVPEKING